MSSSPKHAMCVFGTRPDAIKMAPVVKALAASPAFRVTVAVTGQHREQLDQVLRTFSIVPDIDLNLMQHGQGLPDLTARALQGISTAINSVAPQIVIAQGDTTTTMVAGLAAFYCKVPFAHVEAGLRTADIYEPFPEEMNRRLSAVMAAYHFAPTQAAADNLLSEGVASDRIWVTGNTSIDALSAVAGSDQALEPEVAAALADPRRLVLVTAHRRENWGEPMLRICTAIRRLAERFDDCQFLFAMHRNPVVRETIVPALQDHPGVTLIEPPDYFPFVKLMQRSTLILTDSGGVQEEAPGLGVPVLVLRGNTERPEGVTAGVTRLVGSDTTAIVEAASQLLADESCRLSMALRTNPYGDGRAAERIRDVLAEGMGR